MVVCLTRSRRVFYRTSAVHELPSPLLHLLWWHMHHHTKLSFVDEFRWVSPLHYLKNGWQNALLRWCMLQSGPPSLHNTAASFCCIPASYYHMSTTLQTMSITIVNLQDNRAVFRIFIALLKFSFDSPSYNLLAQTSFSLSADVVTFDRNISFVSPTARADQSAQSWDLLLKFIFLLSPIQWITWTDLTIGGLNAGRWKRLFSPLNHRDRFRGSPSLLVNEHRGWGVLMTTNF